MSSVAVFLACAGSAVAAVEDIRTARIPNWLTYALIVAGFGLILLNGSYVVGILGLLVATLPAFILYLNGTLGGGDVKLLAAVGLLLGVPLIVDVVVWSIISGAILGFVTIAASGRFVEFMRGFWIFVVGVVSRGAVSEVPLTDISLRFAVAVSLATFLVVTVPASRLVSPFMMF